MAISTYGITLKWGATMAEATKKANIKDFPDLGGPPEMIDVTTLSDKAQSFISGIQSLGALEFTLNFSKTEYLAIAGDAGKNFYILEFGNGGSEGAFYWKGRHIIYVLGTGVNASVDARLVIVPSTPPKLRPVLETVTLDTLTEGVESSALVLTYSDSPPEAPVLNYQWKISDTVDGTYTDIVGATSATYTPSSGEVDKYIKVQVTASGGATGVVLSNAQIVESE